MANPEHVAILERGIDAWNHWRRHNTTVKPDLSGAELLGANLRDGDFRKANFIGANLFHSNLTTANFSQAVLTNASLQETTIGHAVFARTELQGTDFSHARLAATVFVDCDLTESKLEDCRILRQSALDIMTLTRSRNLPHHFLRGCGLSDVFIAYLPSFQNDPTQYASCFISYSSSDEAAASRLNNDLWKNGIKTWKWDEDAIAGKDLMGQIGDAIEAHDRVVLLASKAALTSPPVNREIERVMQEEDRRSRENTDGRWTGLEEVLIPVRLDEYIFAEKDRRPLWNHSRRADVIRKMIADGSRWREEAEYKRLFEKIRAALRLPEEKETVR